MVRQAEFEAGRGIVHVPVEHLSHIRYDDDPRRIPLDSVREHGIREPLELSQYGDHLNVEDGKHRLEAARMLGHTHVPARIQVLG